MKATNWSDWFLDEHHSQHYRWRLNEYGVTEYEWDEGKPPQQQQQKTSELHVLRTADYLPSANLPTDGNHQVPRSQKGSQLEKEARIHQALSRSIQFLHDRQRDYTLAKEIRKLEAGQHREAGMLRQPLRRGQVQVDPPLFFVPPPQSQFELPISNLIKTFHYWDPVRQARIVWDNKRALWVYSNGTPYQPEASRHNHSSNDTNLQKPWPLVRGGKEKLLHYKGQLDQPFISNIAGSSVKDRKAYPRIVVDDKSEMKENQHSDPNNESLWSPNTKSVISRVNSDLLAAMEELNLWRELKGEPNVPKDKSRCTEDSTGDKNQSSEEMRSLTAGRRFDPSAKDGTRFSYTITAAELENRVLYLGGNVDDPINTTTKATVDLDSSLRLPFVLGFLQDVVSTTSGIFSSLIQNGVAQSQDTGAVMGLQNNALSTKGLPTDTSSTTGIHTGTLCSGLPSLVKHSAKRRRVVRKKKPTKQGNVDEEYTNDEDEDEDGRDDGGDGDDEIPLAKRQRTSHTIKDVAQGRRLACPFYKRQPDRCGGTRACKGPGWETAHRVKEHIYRVHPQPIHCYRCKSIFSTHAELKTHQERFTSCAMERQLEKDGYTEDQKKLLKSKKNMPGATEEERWTSIYKILFPGDDESKIPSPYYEVEGPVLEELRKLKDYFIEALPSLLNPTFNAEPVPASEKEKLAPLTHAALGPAIEMAFNAYVNCSPLNIPSLAPIRGQKEATALENSDFSALEPGPILENCNLTGSEDVSMRIGFQEFNHGFLDSGWALDLPEANQGALLEPYFGVDSGLDGEELSMNLDQTDDNGLPYDWANFGGKNSNLNLNSLAFGHLEPDESDDTLNIGDPSSQLLYNANLTKAGMDHELNRQLHGQEPLTSPQNGETGKTVGQTSSITPLDWRAATTSENTAPHANTVNNMESNLASTQIYNLSESENTGSSGGLSPRVHLTRPEWLKISLPETPTADPDNCTEPQKHKERGRYNLSHSERMYMCS